MNWWGFIYVNLAFFILILFVTYVQLYGEIINTHKCVKTFLKDPNEQCTQEVKKIFTDILSTPLFDEKTTIHKTIYIIVSFIVDLIKKLIV